MGEIIVSKNFNELAIIIGKSTQQLGHKAWVRLLRIVNFLCISISELTRRADEIFSYRNISIQLTLKTNVKLSYWLNFYPNY